MMTISIIFLLVFIILWEMILLKLVSIQSHFIKVNKVASGIFIVLAIAISILAITLKKPQFLAVSGIYLITGCLAMFACHKKRFVFVTAWAVIFIMSCSTPFGITGISSIYLILFPIIIAALYFDLKLFLVYSAFENIWAIIYILFILGLDTSFFRSLIIIDILVLIIFFLTKCGCELIMEANKNEEKAVQLLDELNITMKSLKGNTAVLNIDISKCDDNLSTILNLSNSITSVIQEIAKGTVDQSESINQISSMMKKADEKVSIINESSKNLTDISAKSGCVVLEASEKIDSMNKQIDIINHAVSKSYTTVQELNSNMDEINNILSHINSISAQTNMLALNAAIEAARAGDAGKGFSVVAEEVRKLAEQSASMTTQISRIISAIKDKVKDVLDVVGKGNTASQEGRTSVVQARESFNMVRSALFDMDKYLSEEKASIDNVANLFSKIDAETESIASISEEHSASAEELMASAEEHNANIEMIYKLMLEIRKTSDNLQKTIIE